MQLPIGVGLFATAFDDLMHGELVSDALLCEIEPCSVKPSVTRATICSSAPLIR